MSGKTIGEDSALFMLRRIAQFAIVLCVLLAGLMAASVGDEKLAGYRPPSPDLRWVEADAAVGLAGERVVFPGDELRLERELLRDLDLRVELMLPTGGECGVSFHAVPVGMGAARRTLDSLGSGPAVGHEVVLGTLPGAVYGPRRRSGQSAVPAIPRFEAGAWHSIRIKSRAGTHWLYVNGVDHGSWVHLCHGWGEIGVESLSGIVRMRELKATSLPTGTKPPLRLDRILRVARNLSVVVLLWIALSVWAEAGVGLVVAIRRTLNQAAWAVAIVAGSMWGGIVSGGYGMAGMAGIGLACFVCLRYHWLSRSRSVRKSAVGLLHLPLLAVAVIWAQHLPLRPRGGKGGGLGQNNPYLTRRIELGQEMETKLVSADTLVVLMRPSEETEASMVTVDTLVVASRLGRSGDRTAVTLPGRRSESGSAAIDTLRGRRYHNRPGIVPSLPMTDTVLTVTGAPSRAQLPGDPALYHSEVLDPSQWIWLPAFPDSTRPPNPVGLGRDSTVTLSHFDELLFAMPESNELAITEISAEIQALGPGGGIDLISRRTVESHHAFRVSSTDSLSSALLHYRGSEAVGVSSSSWRLREGQWTRLALRNDHGRLTGLVNGAPILERPVLTERSGNVGFRSGFEPGVRIRRLQIVVERLDNTATPPLVFLSLW